MRQHSFLPIRRPCKTQARREIFPVCAVGGRPSFELEKLSGAGDRRRNDRVKDIAGAGSAIQTVQRRKGQAVVQRGHRELRFPTQTAIDRQIRTHAPDILREKSYLTVPGAHRTLIEVNILAGILIETRIGIDGCDAADQRRVKILGASEVIVANSGENRRFTGCEKGGHRVSRVQAEVDGGDKGSPGIEIIPLEETPAKTESVRAA